MRKKILLAWLRCVLVCGALICCSQMSGAESSSPMPVLLDQTLNNAEIEKKEKIRAAQEQADAIAAIMADHSDFIDRTGRIVTSPQSDSVVIPDMVTDKRSGLYSKHTPPFYVIFKRVIDETHMQNEMHSANKTNTQNEIKTPDQTDTQNEGHAPNQKIRYEIVEARSRKVVAHLPANMIPEIGSCFPEPTERGLVMVERADPVTGEPLNPHQRGIFDAKRKRMLKLPKSFNGVFPFSCGRASFDVGELVNGTKLKYGFLNTHGKVVIRPVFDEVLPFAENLAPVKRDGHWYFINRAGKVVIYLPDDCRQAERFSEGMAAVKFGGTWADANWKWKGARVGFIDKTGKIVIQPQFLHAGVFTKELCAVMNADLRHLYGYIDKSGRWIIAPQFESAGGFRGADGTAEVKLGTLKFDRELWLKKKQREQYKLAQLNAFLTEYSVMHMKRAEIIAHLGQPDMTIGSDDEYVLSGGHFGKASIIFRYDKGDVSKYKMNYMKDWFDENHPIDCDSL